MNDKQDVSRNDLALRIATDVLGDPSRAGGLAEYFAKENTDVYRALERFAESRCATARAEERERMREAVWEATGPLFDSEGCNCDAVSPNPHQCFPGMMEEALRRALTPTPEPPHA